jgi:hypothetical protein
MVLLKGWLFSVPVQKVNFYHTNSTASIVQAIVSICLKQQLLQGKKKKAFVINGTISGCRARTRDL